ncbi:TIR domain-containing protein [Herbidospora galbida]|uniref:TIR domain-containing protein n=1 Tax=Herbidospora galbida TaxID=2575442 RepID=A0A4V5UZN0_9ACTN|nr:TIR-like protein FxsC [Herbidospora galbida]TKK89313.1 TIR domain-containing protein [Herbidospora galbida]
MVLQSTPRPPGPYFFLSYAHTPNEDPKANRWVAKLFKDLCDIVLELTRLPDPSMAGFMDTGRLLTGHLWSRRLAEALATCQVFVPLYSPRYFVSQNCGREWTAFVHRLNSQPGSDDHRPEAIVPALWTPMQPEALPLVARSIQFSHDKLGPYYRDEGFYGLTKLAIRRAHYQRAAHALATRIVQVGESTPLDPIEPLDFPSLGSAFEDFDAAQSVTLTIVAPGRESLPADRNPFFYGRLPEDWNPFRNEDQPRSLISYAVELATAHGFRTELGTLSDFSPDLLAGKQPTGPGVMIVDPWALTDPLCLAALAAFDRAELPWVSVIIPWNLNDGETAARQPYLQSMLRATLSKRWSDLSTESIDHFSNFRRAFPDALNRAGNQFLRKATPYPPKDSGGGGSDD